MMKTKGVLVLKKLNLLLAVLLCCIFACHTPDTLPAAPVTDTAQEGQLKLTRQAQVVLIAGEVAAEAKGILQLDKLMRGAFLHVLWQRLCLPLQEMAPAFQYLRAFNSDTGLHVIFTQGP